MVYEYCAMAIVLVKDKVLFTIESVKDQARTSLPKGHIEEGETHIQTAIRECEEETGVKLFSNELFKEIEPYEYEFINPFNNDKPTHKTVYPLIFKIDSERTPVITEKNIKLAEYKQIDELIEIATFDNIKNLLRKVKIAANI